MMFWAFVFIRVLMAFLSWGYFVPDETWQSVEVAHKLGTVHVFTVKSTDQILWLQFFPAQRSIFQPFWKDDCCAKFLFFELETSNFAYLLIFLTAKFQKD